MVTHPPQRWYDTKYILCAVTLSETLFEYMKLSKCCTIATEKTLRASRGGWWVSECYAFWGL